MLRPVTTRALLCLAGAALLAGCTSGGTGGDGSGSTVRTPVSTSVTSRVSAPTTTRPAVPAPTASSSTRSAGTPAPSVRSSSGAAARTTASSSSPAAARSLPLGYRTDGADQVVTVVASARSATRATLRTWQRASGGWRQVGPSVDAWLGSDGMSTSPSETRSATPMGSFTLTQAFGHDSDPGTGLPYTHTTPDYWWISEPGPLYNTMQRCSSGCAFTRGDPNEHLYYETPYYNYAVVIDYNRDPVRQGAGSAFFLHVTVGAPTAGCVSIEQSQLVRILRWLRPAQHPRILIGTA